MAKNNNLTDFLTDVADAIREKEGSIAPINPQAFSARILALQTGGSGGGASAAAGAVNFRDYDGTILHSYSKDEFLALTEFPQLPSRTGLMCQGWNWTYGNAFVYVEEHGVLDIGATYITSDGKTRFYIKVSDAIKTISIKLTIDIANGLDIDWGDGINESVSDKGSLTLSHTYDMAGNYVIGLNVAASAKLSIGTSGTSSSYYTFPAPCYNMLYKVEIGERTEVLNRAFSTCYQLSSVTIPNGVNLGQYTFNECYSLSSAIIPNGSSLNAYAFYYCYALSSVSIPNGVARINQNIFSECYSLSSVAIPNSVTSIDMRAFSGCRSLSSITFPKSVTFGTSAFYGCNALRTKTITDKTNTIESGILNNRYFLDSIEIPNSVTKIDSSAFEGDYVLFSIEIPDSVTSIGQTAFRNCRSLPSIRIPNGVTSINANTFYGCSCLVLVDFRAHTSVPTLASTNAFTSIASTCKIVVPDELYDEWIAATNWSSVAKYIVKASEYNG